jgi:hypothetical protein
MTMAPERIWIPGHGEVVVEFGTWTPRDDSRLARAGCRLLDILEAVAEKFGTAAAVQVLDLTWHTQLPDVRQSVQAHERMTKELLTHWRAEGYRDDAAYVPTEVH